jgi:nucleotide-binding universal stress UspA family protein
MSVQASSLTSGMANAGYAAGTVLAVQFAQHLPQRRMLLVYGTLLVIGSVLAADAAQPGQHHPGGGDCGREFVPVPGTQFDAACADEVKQAAEQAAAAGAALAEAAGFRARGLAVEGTPAWKAISDVADEHDASLIVLGSRGRAGLGGHLVGSVAGAVAAHSRRPVLIVHDHGAGPAPGRSP